MFVRYNCNPLNKSVGDCAVRAISAATGKTWEETYTALAFCGFISGDLPNADEVWGEYLRRNGFTRHWIPDECPNCYTVEKFSKDHPKGVYILSMPGRHVVAVVDGNYLDSWDSGNEAPTYYWEKER